MELQWFAEPFLGFRHARTRFSVGFSAVRFVGLLLRFVYLGDEVIEFRHSFILTRLRVFHLVQELLPLELQSAELCLHFDIAFVDVGAHFFLFEGQKTGPQ